MKFKARTKLAEWLKVATDLERSQVALAADTSTNYLYQLAGRHRKNPRLTLALKIVEAANTVRNARVLREGCEATPERCALPLLTLYDLDLDN